MYLHGQKPTKYNGKKRNSEEKNSFARLSLFFRAGSSIYYVSTFLHIFRPTHPTITAWIQYWTPAKMALFWTHPPSPESICWRNIWMVPGKLVKLVLYCIISSYNQDKGKMCKVKRHICLHWIDKCCNMTQNDTRASSFSFAVCNTVTNFWILTKIVQKL